MLHKDCNVHKDEIDVFRDHLNEKNPNNQFTK